MLVQLRIITTTQVPIIAVRSQTTVLLPIPLIAHRPRITTAVRNSDIPAKDRKVIHQPLLTIADTDILPPRQATIITGVPIPTTVIHLLITGITVHRTAVLHQAAAIAEAVPAIHAAVLHRATAVAETAEATVVLRPAAATAGRQVEVQEGK